MKLSVSRPNGEQHIPADDIEQSAQDHEWKQSEEICVRAVEERIVRGRPILDSFAYIDEAWHAGHKRDHD